MPRNGPVAHLGTGRRKQGLLNIYSCALGFGLGLLLTTAGLAAEHATHDEPPNNGSTTVTHPLGSRPLNQNGAKAATAVGHTNSNPAGGLGGVHSPTGNSALIQHATAGGQGRITGTILRKGSGPAAVGGTLKNDGAINGTRFGPRHH